MTTESGIQLPMVIAHRSMTPGAVPNVVSALAPAANAGADLIELDIRLSLDRVPIVIHDAMLWHTTTNHGWIGLYPSAWLRRFRVRGGEPRDLIPTLAELLAAFPNGPLPALHLKDRQALRPVLRVLEKHATSSAWLWLEDPASVRSATRRNPRVRCTLLRPHGSAPQHRDRYFREAEAAGASAVSVPWGMVDHDLVEQAGRHRLLVFSRMEAENRLVRNLEAGIDGIITVDPATVRARIDAWASTIR